MEVANIENKELLTLAGRLNLPEAVLAPLAAAAKALPEGLPVGQLTEPEAAAAAWKTINAQLPVWQEDNGMAQLAVMLAAVCQAEERYHREGTPEDVFLPTMDCFRRFLEETHARTGQWAFDRGFWTWRQAAGLLFRLGTLEFEYRRMRPGPRPEGLEAEAPVLSVHIPSDAVLERKELDTSYNIALLFSPRRDCALGVGPGLWYAVAGSWLRLWMLAKQELHSAQYATYKSTQIKNTAVSVKNEVMEMIAKVRERKGRLDLPIVSGKHLRKISDRTALQSADNAEKFITTRKIDSFESLAKYTADREQKYQQLETVHLSKGQKLSRLKELSKMYALYAPIQATYKESQLLKGIAKMRYDKEHKDSLSEYPESCNYCKEN